LPSLLVFPIQRLGRVHDYVEAHLDEDLSLTVLADVACLSPYHFKEVAGVGPRR
jgi:transcriptional regulator GlxA family with amidase domain